jgi:uncharacterized protein DUF6930
MNIPHCSLSVWRNLYDAAMTFRDLACWDWMSDLDVFGVQNPDNGEIGYCCVLGQLGEFFGLVVYIGTEGLEQYRKVRSGKIRAGSPEFVGSQSCLSAWFGKKRDLDRSDLQVIKNLGLKYHGANAWPQFRALRIGYLPWYLSEDEARYLTLCLEQAREIALCVEKDPNWLLPARKNHYLVRVPIRQTDGWGWESHSLKPALPSKPNVCPYPLDEIRLQRIKKTNQARQGAWEIDGIYIPTPVEGKDRPFFPYSLLCADHESGFILGTVVAEPATWESEFPSSILDCVENHKLMPSVLWVRKEELRHLLEPLASCLGIKVQMAKRLPTVDRARKALLKHLANQR